VSNADLRQINDRACVGDRGRRSRRRVGVVGCLVAVVALAVVGCGESQTPPVYAAVDGYLTSLAQGNFSGACAHLNGAGRHSLARATGSRKSCVKIFDRCLPDRVRTDSKDQTQLNYATVDITTHGATGSATVAGTAVARVVKRVTLAKEGRIWKLTSYGEGLKGCRRRASRRSHA
jgi:hypothetical protein